MYIWPKDQRISFRSNGWFLALLGVVLVNIQLLAANAFPAWLESLSPYPLAIPFFQGIGVLFFAWGSGFIARSKGHTGLWGLATIPFLLLPGLVLILLLQDKWDPRTEQWTEEPNQKLLDGESVEYEFEMSRRLAASYRSKLTLGLALLIGAAACWLVRGVIITESHKTFDLAAGASLFLSMVFMLWGGKHLAQSKHYDTQFAGLGMFIAPLLMFAGPFPSPITMALAVGTAIAGPVFLLLSPCRMHTRKTSPFHRDPSSYYVPDPDMHPASWDAGANRA